MEREDLILQELAKINSRLDTIDGRLDTIDSRLDAIEETTEVTRDSVNALIEWAEAVSNAVRFPLPKI